VAAYGFPNGGETLSITEGVVARVEHGIYVHSGERLLAIQMDAAIAPGSSGGPLLRDGRVVGVAMQSFKDSAIGSAVPAPMVRQFLDDAADGRLQGVPELELRWQKLENPALKASVGLSDGATGVLVTEVGTPAKEVLERGDVLLAVGGRDVADDGTVELRPGERTDLVLAADVRQLGAWLPVLYLRRGTVRQGELRLDRARGDGRLVPRLFDRAADYYIYGGLVFVTLTRNFLDTAGQWAPPRLAALSPRAQGTPGQEVVLLADVLTAEVNAGYELGRWSVVTRVDGQEIRDLADLARLAGQSDGGPLAVFDLDGGERVVVDRTRAAATVGDVLAQYGLASDRSPRLAAILGEATAIETAVVASASGPSEGEER
jgi:S1-C subfamily serine protease